jgi:hypothetical protein
MTNIHEGDGSNLLDGTAAPSSKARAPEAEQTAATHYVYDPQTYEILCRPGQRLSEKKIKRLQELNLYAHAIRPAESHSS